MLGHAPSPRSRTTTAPAAQDAGSALGAAPQQDEHTDAADDRDDDERQPVALEPVEDVACVRVQGDERPGRERARARRRRRARGR